MDEIKLEQKLKVGNDGKAEYQKLK